VRRLVINADDLGLTAAVNRGILEAHAAGAVTSASVLVNTPGWEDARRIVLATPSLGIGLHLNLVQGRPLARVPSLTDPVTEEFHPLGRLAQLALTGRVDRRDVRAETDAQMATLQATGVRVTHVDSHRHAHALPGLWAAIRDAALAAGIDVVRWPAERLWIRPLDVPASLKKLSLAAALRLAARGRTRSADHFVGISLQGCRGGAPALLRVLDGLRPGTTEMMVHVGHCDGELARLDPYASPRELELGALTSEEVRARLRRGDIELIDFGRL